MSFYNCLTYIVPSMLYVLCPSDKQKASDMPKQRERLALLHQQG